MDLDEARDLLRRQHRAVLATWRSDSTPQLSPVTVGVDEDGYAVISSRQTAYKVKNLRRDPRAYLCVFPDSFFGGRWLQLDGTVTIIDLPEAMEPLVEYYRRISGEHPDWADYRAAMVRDQRVLIRMEISKAGPDRHG
jgi:PPOX class probable F420-dependent enzyme